MKIAIWIAVMGIITFAVVQIAEHQLDKKDKNSHKKDEILADKYPKLNAILIVSVLVITVSVLYIIAQQTLVFFRSFLNWLISIPAKLDAVIMVTLISGAVSILGVVITSIIGKVIDYRNKRKEYLSQKREGPYGEFIKMIYEVKDDVKLSDDESYSQNKLADDINEFSKQITLWGSPKIVEKWLEFREQSISEQGSDSKATLVSIESVMNQMRKDLGVKKVKKGQLLGFFINDVKSIFQKDTKNDDKA